MYVCLERTTLAGFAKESEYYNRFFNIFFYQNKLGLHLR